MLFPSTHFRIFLYAKPLDFRSGVDRIAQLCKADLGMNPYGGAVFLFFNRCRDRARVFFYDGSGSCLFFKRLERGRFRVPEPAAGAAYAVVESAELALLLQGADLSRVTKPARWQPKKESEDGVIP